MEPEGLLTTKVVQGEGTEEFVAVAEVESEVDRNDPISVERDLGGGIDWGYGRGRSGRSE